jgi:hypothetical protein
MTTKIIDGFIGYLSLGFVIGVTTGFLFVFFSAEACIL